jgi:hypothetical protein
VRIALPDDERLTPLMMQDKKVRARRLRLVLPVPGARVRVVIDPPMSAVAAGWEAIRTQ